MNFRTRHALGVVAVLVAVACGREPIGYGVVVWSDGGALPTGAVVDLMDESELEATYLARIPAPASGVEHEPLPIRQWRVRRFAGAEQASAFAAAYAPFTATYAYTERSGLPIRAEASATAAIIYKLRPGELLKVVGRGDEPVTVGVYENHWYEVLAEDGTVGHTFGEFLVVLDTDGDPQAEIARRRAADPLLERVLTTVWRPAYFSGMIRTGRYDLTRFRADYGLFPEPAAQQFTLVGEGGTRRFPYREIERVGANVYVLHPPGGAGNGDAAPARITVLSDTHVALSYVLDGRLVTPEFLDLQRDVPAQIAAERARRDLLFADLMRRGAQLTSSSYGTFTLRAGRRFQWHGYDALVPGLVPSGLAGSGSVDFRYAPAAALGGSYDGAATFTFDRPGEPVELTLLVEYGSGGVRLTPAVPNRAARLVAEVSRSAVVMFFTFSDPPAGDPPADPGAGDASPEDDAAAPPDPAPAEAGAASSEDGATAPADPAPAPAADAVEEG